MTELTMSSDDIVETTLEIGTPDGSCDAAFVHPATGVHPAVIFWPDGLGLRPSIRQMARRLAPEGYAVLVPNPFYRVAKAPIVDDASTFNFGDTAQRDTLMSLIASMGAAGAAERDAAAFVAWLDRQPQVDRAKKIGTQGYCMGGALVFRTMAAIPTRLGAGASFHGGGLVTPSLESPHLLVPRMNGALYVGIAVDDDLKQPDAKTTLREAFDAANVQAEIEVYSQARHGWCVADMPPAATGPIYSKADADRAWAKLLALYKRALA